MLSPSKHKKLAKILAVKPLHLKAAIDYIKTLRLSPFNNSYSYDSGYELKNEQIIADILIKHKSLLGLNTDDIVYEAYINDDIVPNVTINKEYISINTGNINADNFTYVKNKLQQANYLIYSIQQRFNTLLKVARYIVAHQQNFFKYGEQSLHKLVMQDIAIALNLNVSTVSRAIKHKYIAYNNNGYKLIPLRFLLSNGMQTSSMYSLKQIIQLEDDLRPLSDAKIAILLNAQYYGLNLSRRTIAKYRKQLGILPSYMRKNNSN
jgi:RNA polymerase sigma-54 factor